MPGILVAGHSHLRALRRGYALLRGEGRRDIEFLLLRDIDKADITARIARVAPDVAVLCINGNEHTAAGLFKNAALDIVQRAAYLESAVPRRLAPWLDFLLPLLPKRVLFCSAPPPTSAPSLDGNFPAERIAPFKEKGLVLEAPEVRLAMWQLQCKSARSVCLRHGIEYVEPPAGVFDEAGLLVRDCWNEEPTHGGAEYGRRMLRHVFARIDAPQGTAAPAGASSPTEPLRALSSTADITHPYASLPDTCFWKQSVALVAPTDVDPVVAPSFVISRSDQVATAGSCFAQHISKRLRGNGFRFFIAEAGNGGEPDNEERGFYDFSARYGNLYTARQLLQLFDRAFGYYRPIETVWHRHGGGYCDPFRPRIEPEGFATVEALHADRVRHLAAVRRMFHQLDVFVFTLGLTECWMSRLDGAVYPVAPGIVGGEFDPDKHVFANFSVREVAADLETFIARLRVVNPAARMILTVSPVPLAATAADRHVLVSTVYSKSVLRVAVEEVSRAHTNVSYFPSYEIITGPHAAGAYFAADRRSVTEAGVDHVMRVFMKHITRQDVDGAQVARLVPDAATNTSMAEMQAIANVICDEEMLER